MTVTDGGRREATAPRRFRALAAAAGVLALALWAAAPAAATLPFSGPPLRISTVGADGDTGRAAFDPQATYNPAAGEFLVVWAGNGLTDPALAGKTEIFGRRMSASGAELGPDFRISNTAPELDPTRGAARPSVAYNSHASEYLVVWQADGLGTDGKTEVYGQRLSAAGADLGGDVQLSTTGGEAEANRDATDPSATYNRASDQYLVVWSGDPLAVPDQDEIFGQLVSAAGAEVGADIRISRTGTPDSVGRDATRPRVAYGSGPDRFLVVWQADALAVDDKVEIFGAPISSAGQDVGPNFRISTTGGDGDAARGASDAAVGYGDQAHEFLVVWRADGLATDDEFEIFGQRVDVVGSEMGGDTRLSTTGADGDADRDAQSPSIAFGDSLREFLVSWDGDGLAVDGEPEVFGQRVSGAGAEVGADFRVSTTGPDGDAGRAASRPALAGAGPAGYLAVWQGDALTAGEVEIFGRRMGVTPAPAIDTGSVRATANGRVPIALSCAATGVPCRGQLVLRTAAAIPARLLATASQRRQRRARRVVLGRVSYTIPAGRRARASVRLSRRHRRLLRRRGSVRTRVTVTPRGGGRAASRTIRVRAPRRR